MILIFFCATQIHLLTYLLNSETVAQHYLQTVHVLSLGRRDRHEVRQSLHGLRVRQIHHDLLVPCLPLERLSLPPPVSTTHTQPMGNTHHRSVAS